MAQEATISGQDFRSIDLLLRPRLDSMASRTHIKQGKKKIYIFILEELGGRS